MYFHFVFTVKRLYLFLLLHLTHPQLAAGRPLQEYLPQTERNEMVIYWSYPSTPEGTDCCGHSSCFSISINKKHCHFCLSDAFPRDWLITSKFLLRSIELKTKGHIPWSEPMQCVTWQRYRDNSTNFTASTFLVCVE